MRIEHVNFRNYRCFEDLDIDFHNRMTVIVGTNGSGKTSVLEGTVVALGTFFSEMDGLRDISLTKKDVRLKAYAMGEADDVQLQYPVSIAARGSIEGQSIEWSHRALQPSSLM